MAKSAAPIAFTAAILIFSGLAHAQDAALWQGWQEIE